MMTKRTLTILCTLAVALAGASANAEAVLLTPSAGQAAFDSEASLFTRTWSKVCYTGGGTTWRAWMNPVQIPSDAASLRAYQYTTNDPSGLVQSRMTSWQVDGTLWDWSSWTSGTNIGTIYDIAQGAAAVHTRFKSDASGTQPCLTRVAVEWP